MKKINEKDIARISGRGRRTKKNIVGFSIAAGPKFRITEQSHKVLDRALECWDAMSAFRRQTRRSGRFYKGDQWQDMVCENGEWMTEEEWITRQGKPALKQNLIRPQVRNVIGQLRASPYKSIIYARNENGQLAADMMSVALESVHTMNDEHERDARLFETFLVSGAGVYRTGYAYDDERKMPVPYYVAVDLSRYFRTIGATDVNGKDVDFCGDFEDYAPEKVKATYAKTPAEELELEEIYGNGGRADSHCGDLVRSDEQLASPLVNPIDGKWRVIHACQQEGRWQLAVHDYADASWETYDATKANREMIYGEQQRRLRMAEELGLDYSDPLNRLRIDVEERYVVSWMYYHLTPYGHVLWQQECPYEHNSHNYVEKFYPMFEGQAYGMVFDLIDAQKMINRNIILQEFISSAAAKGVLLVPEDAIPDDMTIEDFADEWSRYNGVIKIKAKDGVKMPEQVVSRQINVGQFDMINLQMKLMSDIGGVHDALQGKMAGTGTPASLYQQETANAQLNILDYMESFSYLLMKRDYKMVQIIRQFYTDRQYIQLGGSEYSEAAKHYDPEVVRNYDYYNEIVKSHNTPMAKMFFEDLLWRMMEANRITLEMYLEESDTPFSKSLLKKIQALTANGQMPTQGDVEKLKAGVPASEMKMDSEAMEKLYTGIQ